MLAETSCQEASPLASDTSALPGPGDHPVIFTCQTISSLAHGEAVPIPILPPLQNIQFPILSSFEAVADVGCAELPIMILFEPEVRVDPARFHTATFPAPLIREEYAPYPSATVVVVVALLFRAFHPKAVLERIFPPHRPTLRVLIRISAPDMSIRYQRVGVAVPTPMLVPSSKNWELTSPFPQAPNFGSTFSVPPTTPEAVEPEL